LVAVLAAAAVLVAGCGSGPSKVNAAAIIDGRTISVDDIQSRVDNLMRDNKFAQQLQQQHKLDLLSRSIVSREVIYELMGKAAAQEQLQVEPGALGQRVAQRGAPQDLPAEALEANLQQATDAAFDPTEVARNELLAEELAKKYLSRLSVTLDGALINAPDAKDQAVGLAKQFAKDPAKSTDIAKKLVPSQDPNAPQPDPNAPRGLAGEKLSLISALLISSQAGFQLATSALYSAKVNDVVAFSLANLMVQQDGSGANAWFVGVIKTRDTNATLSDDEKTQVASVPQSFLLQIGNRLADQYSGGLQVEISPRYGVWDPVGNSVAPRPEEVTGYVYPAAPTNQ
jgi:hypothetical protein